MTPAFPTLILNTVGEPGSGKTTLSFWLSQALKKAGVVTEFVPEVVKYECFDPKGQARVRSGRFDHRYLALQSRFLRPLLGNVEVVINDGAYELFYFYAQYRMESAPLARFRSRVEELRAEADGKAEQWFVMPQRQYAYDQTGRNENEEQAQALRQAMVNCLGQGFGVQVRQAASEEDKQAVLEAVLDWVSQARQRAAQPAQA